MTYKIIDFHVHAFDDKIARKATENLMNYYDMPAVGDGRFSAIYNQAVSMNVSKMVIHAVATKASQVEKINSYIAKTVQTDPNRIIGFAAFHRDYNDADEEIKRIKRLGLRGIKLHADFQGFKVDDDKMLKLYEKFAEASLPVLFHAGDRKIDNSSPKRIARVLEKVPQLCAVAAHMGGAFRWDESEEYLVGKDIYFDTSSTFFELPVQRFLKMANAHGFEKIMFGTDYPLSDYKKELAYYENIPLSEENRKKIFYENACHFLNIEP